MDSAVTYPVQVLAAHLSNLQLAIASCLEEPAVRPVHKLRTETRRAAALLGLLGQMQGMPEHEKQADALGRVLRKLRRAGGKVRDLDVHRQMLDALAKAAPTKEDVVEEGGESLVSAESAVGGLGDSAHELHHRMGHQREKAAERLQAVLAKHQKAATRAGERLLAKLDSAQGKVLGASQILQYADKLLREDGLLLKPVKKLSRAELHQVRKAAKAARYVAESLPGEPVAVAAAEAFEALQESGGQWHDAWQLARAARRCFGKEHPLTRAYREAQARTLERYREALAAYASQPASEAPEATLPRVPLRARGRGARAAVAGRRAARRLVRPGADLLPSR